VKIRYYGSLSSKQKEQRKPLQTKKPETTAKETAQERIAGDFLLGRKRRLKPKRYTSGKIHTENHCYRADG